jgi:hypothetical protein
MSVAPVSVLVWPAQNTPFEGPVNTLCILDMDDDLKSVTFWHYALEAVLGIWRGHRAAARSAGENAFAVKGISS